MYGEVGGRQNFKCTQCGSVLWGTDYQVLCEPHTVSEGRNVPSGWGSSGGGGVGVGRTDGLTGPGASSSTSTMLRSWSSLLASKLAVQGLDFVHIDNAFLHSSHQFFFSSRLVDTITMTPDHWGSSEHFQERRLMETPSDVNSSRHIFELLLIGSNNLNRSARLLPPARPDQRWGRLWSALVLNGTHFPSTCPALSSFSHHLVPLSPSLFNLSPPCSNSPLLVQTLPLLVQPPVLLVQPPPLPYSNLLVPCSSYCPIFLFILLFGFAPF